MSLAGPVGDLKTSLRAFLDAVDGEQRSDKFSPAFPGKLRDTPGGRAAASASSGPAPDPAHTGQDTTNGRRRHLPENVQQTAGLAERLLTLLDRAGDVAPASPGQRAASSSSINTRDLGAAIRNSQGFR